MSLYKKLLFVLLFCASLNAMMIDDIVYVEHEDASKISLKDEFINPNTKYYTLTVATLKNPDFDMIGFFKTYNLTNAVAYKYGKNKEYVRVISGVYKTGTQASNDIKNLHFQIQENKPYSSKLFRHQKNFEANPKITKVDNLKEKSVSKPKFLREANGSIFIEDTKEAKQLKEEFLKKDSTYYSIALGTVDLNRNSLKNFYDAFGVSKKALAHLYGKNKDKVRIIYGLYKNRKEANTAINNFNNKLKANSPFTMQMKKFQSFYSKSFPKGKKEAIIKLKVNKKETNEKSIQTKISDNIKILKAKKIEKIDLKKPIKEEKKKKIIKKVKKIVNKEPKKQKPKVKKQIKKAKKIDLNKNRFLKEASLEDVYFVESSGNFNILSEVFLKDGSSFYTVDLGELDLQNTSIEKFFLNNALKDNALAYKYGENKEFARVIYGAFETKKEAQNRATKLKVDVENLKVSNIKNHQKLYKEFHKSKKKTEAKKSKEMRTFSGDILYGNKKLKDEFLNEDTVSYTITLITFLKDEIDLRQFLIKNNLKEDTLAYSLGSANNYYRVLYGNFDNYSKAKEAIDNLSNELKSNTPYVSKVRTQQRKFESYNQRRIANQMAKKIEYKY